MVPPTLVSAFCAMCLDPTLSNLDPSSPNTYPSFHSLFAPCASSSPLASFSISNAADKEVEDYYTRKRHLPDLAARGTLPLHVLKLTQEQVGALFEVQKKWMSKPLIYLMALLKSLLV